MRILRPGHNCSRFETCDWVDENGDIVIHERTYRRHLPARHCPIGFVVSAAMSGMRTEFWLVTVSYSSQVEVDADSKRYGFTAMLDPYCEDGNETWFPVFDDMEPAIDYLKSKWGKEYVL